MNPLRTIFGSKNDRDIKKLRPLVKQIESYEGQMLSLIHI